MAKKWMKAAFANSHGQYSARANKRGHSTQQQAKLDLKSKSTTTHVKRQASLALRGSAISKAKKHRDR